MVEFVVVGGGISGVTVFEELLRVLIEAHDEWQDSDRRYLSEASMALLNPPPPTVLEAKTAPPTKTTKRRIAATA